MHYQDMTTEAARRGTRMKMRMGRRVDALVGRVGQ
jgi:hypothetical protein